MVKKRKFRNQTIVFNIPSTVGKDLFLRFAMDIIGDNYVHVESKMNKISLQVQGERSLIAGIVEKLTMVSSQLNDAVVGKKGKYEYHIDLLNKLFQPHLKPIFFEQTIKIYGHDAEFRGKQLVSSADYFELEEIHKKASNAMKIMQSDQDRDIQKLFALLYLDSGMDELGIADIALENNVLRLVDGQYQFAINKDLAFDRLRGLLNQPVMHPTIDLPEGEELSFNDFFDGGKIVFLKNGKELDSSTFDIVNKTKDREE